MFPPKGIGLCFYVRREANISKNLCLFFFSLPSSESFCQGPLEGWAEGTTPLDGTKYGGSHRGANGWEEIRATEDLESELNLKDWVGG